MNNWLIKTTIKNHTRTEEKKVRAAYGYLAGIAGIICNVALFIAKFITGTILNSISIVADSLNNISDAGSSVISIIGIRLAGKPADRKHPFGHGRLEYITSFVISFFILAAGAALLQSSVKRIFSRGTVGYSNISLLILAVSAFIKLWLSIFNKKIGKLIDSQIQKSTAADAMNDFFITLATILSLLIIKFAGINIDGYIGAGVSIYIIISGLLLIKKALEPLIGEGIDKKILAEITDKVRSYDKIIGCHDLVIHSYGPSKNMASIHVEVPNNADIEEIHRIVDNIERDVYKETGIAMVIHTDPVAVESRELLEKKAAITAFVKKIEPEAEIHDFRCIRRSNSDNTGIIFDLVVPYSYGEDEKRKLVQSIKKETGRLYADCFCDIFVENGFVSDE